MASRAHVFFSSRQQKCDDQVKEFCTSKENCRRTMMLQALGVTETHPVTLPCCDVCDNRACPQYLNFTDTTLTNARRKRRTAVKVIDDTCKLELKAALLREVDMYIEEHPSYRMLGRDFVCPSCVIEKICSEARFFNSVDDLNIVLLRPELKMRFFNVFCNITSNAPSPKKRHRMYM